MRSSVLAALAATCGRSVRRDVFATLAIAAGLLGASAGALAQGAGRVLGPNELWVTHLALGALVALVAYLAAARSWPLGGIVVVVAAWYAAAQGFGSPAGGGHAAHLQASALLVPALALAGIALRAARARRAVDAKPSR
jgi:hypothetical protein